MTCLATARENRETGREKQSVFQVAVTGTMVYFLIHADGETRRRRHRGNSEAKPTNGYGAAKAEPGRTPDWRVRPERTGNRAFRARPETRTGIPRDRRASFHGQQVFGSANPPRRRGERPEGLQRSKGRGCPPDRTAAGFGRRQTPDRSWVPGPAPTGTRTPRGLRLRPMLPRGFLVFPGVLSQRRPGYCAVRLTPWHTHPNSSSRANR